MMKNKYLVSILTVLVCLIMVLPSSVLANDESVMPSNDSEVCKVSLEDDSTEYGIENGNTKSNGYYYWKVTSKTISSHPYGEWRLGPRGRGPGTIELDNTSGYNLSVTNTISGSYTSIGDISASLGVTIGVSVFHSCHYSLTPPSGVRWRILYRPQYTKYKVVQKQYYKIDGHSTPTGNTKTCYVKVFLTWDYDYRVE